MGDNEFETINPYLNIRFPPRHERHKEKLSTIPGDEFRTLTYPELREKMRKANAIGCLSILDERGEGVVYLLPEKREITIGRNPDNQVVVPGGLRSVSRRHASVMISRDPREDNDIVYRLTDRGSKNGSRWMEDGNFLPENEITRHKAQLVEVNLGVEVFPLGTVDAGVGYVDDAASWLALPKDQRYGELVKRRATGVGLQGGNKLSFLRPGRLLFGSRKIPHGGIRYSMREDKGEEMPSSFEPIYEVQVDEENGVVSYKKVDSDEVQEAALGEGISFDVGNFSWDFNVVGLVDTKHQAEEARETLDFTHEVDGAEYTVDLNFMFRRSLLDPNDPEQRERCGQIAREVIEDYHIFERSFRSFVGDTWNEELYKRIEVASPLRAESVPVGVMGHAHEPKANQLGEVHEVSLNDLWFEKLPRGERQILNIHEMLHRVCHLSSHFNNTEEAGVELLAAGVAFFRQRGKANIVEWENDQETVEELRNFMKVLNVQYDYRRRAEVMSRLVEKFRHGFQTFAEVFLREKRNFIVEVMERLEDPQAQDGDFSVPIYLDRRFQSAVRVGRKEKAAIYDRLDNYAERLVHIPNAPGTVFGGQI